MRAHRPRQQAYPFLSSPGKVLTTPLKRAFFEEKEVLDGMSGLSLLAAPLPAARPASASASAPASASEHVKKQKVEEEEQEHADTPATATVPSLDLANPAAEVADAGAAAAATPAAADDEDDDDADDDDDDDAEGCPADLLAHRLVPSMVRPPERGAHPVPSRQTPRLKCGGCQGRLLRARFDAEEHFVTARNRRCKECLASNNNPRRTVTFPTMACDWCDRQVVGKGGPRLWLCERCARGPAFMLDFSEEKQVGSVLRRDIVADEFEHESALRDEESAASQLLALYLERAEEGWRKLPDADPWAELCVKLRNTFGRHVSGEFRQKFTRRVATLDRLPRPWLLDAFGTTLSSISCAYFFSRKVRRFYRTCLSTRLEALWACGDLRPWARRRGR
jgi:hypothetical protein